MAQKKYLQPPSRKRRSREIDIVAVGELLVDIIGQTLSESLGDVRTFERFQGGSPANFAANMARLGNASALVACVGNENLGKYLVQSVKKTGVICDFIAVEPVAPTTIVLVSRTTGTPDFIAYRTADRMILPAHISDALLQKTRIYHTTCFALSQEPAQSSIVDGARRAARFGCKLSIDVNYAPSIWGDRDEARRVIAEYCSHGAFVKMSLDDIVRLFDDPSLDEKTAIATFHNWGAELICLTKGAEGSLVSWENGQKVQHQSARKISNCADVTGAGDAFWSGFLTAWLDGYEPPECAVAGSNIAAMKLAVIGPLPEAVPREKIYEIFD